MPKNNRNIIITGGGRWVGLVSRMKVAQQKVTSTAGGKLFIASTEALTPAGCYADDSFIVPPACDPSYPEALLYLCRVQNVGLVIPTMDSDLKALSPHVDMFVQQGITLCMNGKKLCDLALDKWAFYEFCTACGFNVPSTYLNPETLPPDAFPLFAKPRYGHGSIGAQKLKTQDDLDSYRANTEEDFIVQHFINAPEISIDALVDRAANILIAVPRRRIKTLGGEAVKSETVPPSPVLDVAKRALEKLASQGFWGAANIQIFETDQPVLIEVNARLGSAGTLTDAATQGRYYASLLELASGQTVSDQSSEYDIGLSLYRYFGDIYHKDDQLVEQSP